MKKYLLAIAVVIALVFVFARSRATTAVYELTIELVDASGNVFGGAASATTAVPNFVSRVVDATGHVLNSLVGPGSGAAYDIGFSISGAPVTNLIVPFNCVRTVNFAMAFAGSSASCGTNPGESDAYNVSVAGSSIGSVILSTSCVASFATALGGPQTCIAGQRLELDAPATVSGTNIAITLFGKQ